MEYKLTIFFCLLSTLVLSQKIQSNYSIECGFGASSLPHKNQSISSNFMGTFHGLRYNFNQTQFVGINHHLNFKKPFEFTYGLQVEHNYVNYNRIRINQYPIEFDLNNLYEFSREEFSRLRLNLPLLFSFRLKIKKQVFKLNFGGKLNHNFYYRKNRNYFGKSPFNNKLIFENNTVNYTSEIRNNLNSQFTLGFSYKINDKLVFNSYYNLDAFSLIRYKTNYYDIQIPEPFYPYNVLISLTYNFKKPQNQ